LNAICKNNAAIHYTSLLFNTTRSFPSTVTGKLRQENI